MQIIADLQLHSKYSRAVSDKMELSEISRWSSLKGIDLVATSDWTHPLWFKNIETELEETNDGIYMLKQKQDDQKHEVRFLLSTEISSIYTQGDQVRRVHNLIFSPSLETCRRIIATLKLQGANLHSDGRPIVGISSKDLLEMVLGIDENVLFIPAHAWTPWFAIFGSKSGFDSIEECFGEEGARNIYAIETGLSSDPIMNWQIKELENRSIVSFSDAHSGPKLGREATVFVPSTNEPFSINQLTYNDVADAIRQFVGAKLKIGYTIEVFPEEGKYHWTGHRTCNVRLSPKETKEKGIICLVCQKPLTVGVENRVLDLSEKLLTDKDLLFIKNKFNMTFVYDKEKKRRPFVSLIPLLEVLTETNKGSPTKALREYMRLTTEYKTEFDILLHESYDEIEKQGGTLLRQAIEIIRNRKVFVDPGYDGVFGKVKIFKEDINEKPNDIPKEQQSLF